MGLPGRYFEIWPDQADNPHHAIVATDSDYELGEVLVIPPFLVADEYLAAEKDDVGVELTHKLTTKDATLLAFNAADVQREDVEGAVRHTVSQLLGELGRAASKTIFLEDYGIKTDER